MNAFFADYSRAPWYLTASTIQLLMVASYGKTIKSLMDAAVIKLSDNSTVRFDDLPVPDAARLRDEFEAYLKSTPV